MLIRQLWPVKQLGILGLRSLSRANMWPALTALSGSSLRVLMYHRVCDPEAPGFFGMKSVVSARPRDFAAQMDYLCKNYNLVSLEECLAWTYEAQPLPPRALLITFDDGYRDNLTHALPILAARKIPFVLFAATGYLDDERVFFWDWVAEAFRHSAVKSAKLPKLGNRSWDAGNYEAVAGEWVLAVAPLDESSRSTAIAELSQILKYEVFHRPPAGTHLSWSDLEEMIRNGCTIGAHTVSHQMMVGLELEKAAQEVAFSKSSLERKLGVPVLSFAFPYGRKTDYDTAYLSVLRQSGIKIAFRSTGAINFASGARRNPLEIRRGGVGLCSRLEDVAAQAAGASRLWDH